MSGGCLGAVWEVSKGCSGGIHLDLLTIQTIFMHGFSHFAAPVALPGFFAESSSLFIFVLLNRVCPFLFCGAPAATPLPISAATRCTQADGSTRGISPARTASSTPSGGLTPHPGSVVGWGQDAWDKREALLKKDKANQRHLLNFKNPGDDVNTQDVTMQNSDMS